MKLKVILLCILMLSYAVAIAAEDKYDVLVRASVDRKIILIGDRIKYTIDVKSAKDIDVEFPTFSDDKIGEFEIKDTQDRKVRGLFSGYTITRLYYITAYSPGKENIPTLEVKHRQRQSKEWQAKKTPAINIKIDSILPTDKVVTDIKDIKGPLYPAGINWLLVTAILAVFLILAVLVIMMKLMRKAPAKLPHETALEELEAMRVLLAQTGNIKEYYVGVSDCIRRYIETVFKLKAPEMTTEEFLNSLSQSIMLGVEYKDLLKDFLSACDLVKFAKYTPTKAEIDGVSNTAKKFIEETKKC